jgi:histidyl-tRNA synthetase
LETAGVSGNAELDLSLARGLNYYTGAIFEVKARDAEIGSICGGGRYDDLTGIFGMPGVSGVGISFGAERIYDVLLAQDKFPVAAGAGTLAIFANFGDKEQEYIIPLLSELRKAGVKAELYPDNVKLKKQFDYASKKSVPYMIIAGEEEMRSRTVNIKNLATGLQETLSVNDLCSYFDNISL